MQHFRGNLVLDDTPPVTRSMIRQLLYIYLLFVLSSRGKIPQTTKSTLNMESWRNATCGTTNAHSFRNTWFHSLWEFMISPIHYIYITYLSSLELCLRINAFGLFAWISLIALSRISLLMLPLETYLRQTLFPKKYFVVDKTSFNSLKMGKVGHTASQLFKKNTNPHSRKLIVRPLLTYLYTCWIAEGEGYSPRLLTFTTRLPQDSVRNQHSFKEVHSMPCTFIFSNGSPDVKKSGGSMAISSPFTFKSYTKGGRRSTAPWHGSLQSQVCHRSWKRDKWEFCFVLLVLCPLSGDRDFWKSANKTHLKVTKNL